jgi:TonB-like protein
MKLNEYERARPNIAGLASPVQRAEMKLLLAGGWPPLKPLPVFKYETDEYRASIDFDKTRGEWVCRKASLPSNKVQELRGGLTEIIKALPHGEAEVFAECAPAGQQEQELEKDASRRLQALLEWRENYENGALYSGLRNYLSESQRDEIDDIIRLTLTARQLQFNPKNVAYVFDALSKSGGKLTTLLEIAQRNKTEQGAGVPAHVEPAAPGAEQRVFADLTAEARNPISGWIASEKPAPEFEDSTPAPVQSLIPATLVSFPEEPSESVFPEQEQPPSPELIVHSASQASKIATPEILDANSPSSIEDFQETAHHHAPVTGSVPPVRTGKFESSAHRIENSPPHIYALELSGFQIAAFAFVFLFAVIAFTVGLTVGRGPLGKRLRDAQISILADDTTSPALPNRQGETTSRTYTPPVANTFNTPAVNSPAPLISESRSESPSAQSLNARPEDSISSPTKESKPSGIPEASPGLNGSAGLIARNAPPPASPKPAHLPKTVDPISAPPRNPTPLSLAPATGATPHPSPPSTILVTAPVHGSKPFRVTFPEKPIAASSSFAMTSQLSVLVSPELGHAVARKPARLQAGELAFFVWPRYPRPGDRYGSAETVKVRTTIGPFGQVLDVKLVSGSISLLPAAMSAIRLWRYKPTLLNKRPVQVQQDVTIEFRPPQYLSRVRTEHPSPK